jgi:hypothetical protein
MKWGPKIKSGFYHNLEAKGLLREGERMPEVGPYSFYLGAFRELSSCRTGLMGPSPIPFSAIREYASIYIEEGPDEFEDFLYLIRCMDDAYLEDSEKNGNTTSSESNKNTSGHKRGRRS